MIILLALAGAGIGASVVLSGANMITTFVGIGSVLIAGFGIVTAPWLSRRSAPGAVASTVTGVAGEALALLLLLTSPATNSDLWMPINLGRFGGVLFAQLGVALALHAAYMRTLGPGRVAGLVLTNGVALGIAAVIAAWETRG